MNFKLPLAATLAAVMAVSSLGINAASAAPAAKLPTTHQQSAAEDGQLIQVQAKKPTKKRVVRRNRGNDAAAAAAFVGIAGAMIGLAAQDSRRDRYYDRGGYYYGDSGYYGNRGYYSGNRGYGNRVYSGNRGNYNGGRVTTPMGPNPGQPSGRANPSYPNPRPDMGAGGNPGNYVGAPAIQNDGMSR